METQKTQTSPKPGFANKMTGEVAKVETQKAKTSPKPGVSNKKTGEKTKAEAKKLNTPPKPAVSNKTKKDALSYLNHLRSTGQELCNTISSNIARDILEAIDLVNAVPEKGVGVPKKNKKDGLAKTLSILGRLTIKPGKGRRGDLKKIEKTIRAVKDALSSGKNG